MHRVIASLLATALFGPPVVADPVAESEPETTAAQPAADPVGPEEDAGDEAPEATPAPHPSGLPSVDDPAEQASEALNVPEPEPEPDEKSPEPARPEGPEPAPAAAPIGKDRLGCEFSKSCRQLTVTGTVLGSLGLAAVASGIGLFVRDDVVNPDEPAYATSTKPPGLIAMTLGSGIVITSVLMLIASHRGQAKGAPAAGAAAAALAPVWKPL